VTTRILEAAAIGAGVANAVDYETREGMDQEPADTTRRNAPTQRTGSQTAAGDAKRQRVIHHGITPADGSRHCSKNTALPTADTPRRIARFLGSPNILNSA